MNIGLIASLAIMNELFFYLSFFAFCSFVYGQVLIVTHSQRDLKETQLQQSVKRMQLHNSEEIFVHFSTERQGKNFPLHRIQHFTASAEEGAFYYNMLAKIVENFSQFEGPICLLDAEWEATDCLSSYLQRFFLQGSDLYLSPNLGFPHVILCKNIKVLMRMIRTFTKSSLDAESLLQKDFQALPLAIRPFGEIGEIDQLDVCKQLHCLRHLSYLFVEILGCSVYMEKDEQKIHWRKNKPYFGERNNSPLLLFIPTRMMFAS